MSDRFDKESVTPEAFRRIREVFESALERPVDQRETFVETACGGDTHFMQEVQRMLAAEAQSLRTDFGFRDSRCQESTDFKIFPPPYFLSTTGMIVTSALAVPLCPTCTARPRSSCLAMKTEFWYANAGILSHANTL
jgi:hypothetical protein